MTNIDFTVDSFCSAISSSRPTVYRMIKQGELHAYKIRNSTRIPHTELARLQQDNQIKPASTKSPLVC